MLSSINEKTNIEKMYLKYSKDESNVFYIDDSMYVFPDEEKVMTFDRETGDNKEMEIDYIYRHKVDKAMYEIEDEYGNTVTVTEDHSIMVERNGDLISVKPTELEEDDILYTV